MRLARDLALLGIRNSDSYPIFFSSFSCRFSSNALRNTAADYFVHTPQLRMPFPSVNKNSLARLSLFKSRHLPFFQHRFFNSKFPQRSLIPALMSHFPFSTHSFSSEKTHFHHHQQQIQHSSLHPAHPLRFFSSESGKDKNKDKEQVVEAKQGSDPLDNKVNATASTGNNAGFQKKIKELTRKYGWIAGGTYFGVYLTTLASLTFAVHSGLDVATLVSTIGLDRWIDLQTIRPEAGAFVIGFILTKFTSPIRIVIVATLVPYVAKVVEKIKGKK